MIKSAKMKKGAAASVKKSESIPLSKNPPSGRVNGVGSAQVVAPSILSIHIHNSACSIQGRFVQQLIIGESKWKEWKCKMIFFFNLFQLFLELF